MLFVSRELALGRFTYRDSSCLLRILNSAAKSDSTRAADMVAERRALGCAAFVMLLGLFDARLCGPQSNNESKMRGCKPLACTAPCCALIALNSFVRTGMRSGCVAGGASRSSRHSCYVHVAHSGGGASGRHTEHRVSTSGAHAAVPALPPQRLAFRLARSTTAAPPCRCCFSPLCAAAHLVSRIG